MESEDRQVSKNFKLSELACPCCGLFNMPEQMIEFLQDVRDRFRFAMKINSAVRCREHNKDVGGTRNSAHLHGLAVDVRITSNVLRARLVRCALESGCRRIGIGKTYVHLDIMASVVDETMWLY
jgi:hypothetical protein